MAPSKKLVPYPRASKKYDWLFALLSVWLVGGLFIDALVATSKGYSLAMFFSPQEGLFYVGFGTLFGIMLLAMARAKHHGYKWPHLLPKQYMASFVGALVFLVGMLLDAAWRINIGVQANMDALLSPTHLIVALGVVLMITGPLRSLWHHEEKPSNLKDSMPMLISLSMLWSFIGYITQYLDPLVKPWMTLGYERCCDSIFAITVGPGGVIISTAVLVGLLMFVLKKWRLPFGSITILYAIHALLIGIISGQLRFLISSLIAGLLTDWIYDAAKSDKWSPRFFAFVVPFVYWTSYVLTVFITEGTWWSVNLWMGQVVLSGLVGWLISYIFVEPGPKTPSIATLAK